MGHKEDSSRTPSGDPEGALHESFETTAVPTRRRPAAARAQASHASPEAKRRRAKLLAELNAGWSEESERALSLIASHFFSKS